jgi:SAM-dependent methyltransferase
MNHKDYFSTQSKEYATYRPTYPVALYDFLFQDVSEKCTAWDCATGNGQVAFQLSEYADSVYATDISEQQLNNAKKKDNIFYSVSPAEKTTFPDHKFDLITVGQALHWFDREKFYAEVQRVGKPRGRLAVWGYALMQIDDAVDNVINEYYSGTVGPYWDDARRDVESEYRNYSFPFAEITTPVFEMEVNWNRAQLSGYLSSWSATQRYQQATKHNPIPSLIEKLLPRWNDDEIKKVRFPIFLRLFII